MNLLGSVASFSAENGMTVYNLACTLAPVLCRPHDSAFMSLRHMRGMPRVTAVVQLVLEARQHMFKVCFMPFVMLALLCCCHH